jgi:hypothetical protein
VAYALEATSDFVTWVALGTNVAAGFTMTLTDTNSAGIDERFYRVRRINP